jgi:phage shock protein C
MSRRERTLYRDTENKKIGGVCSGLARYFDLDPLLVRVAFVAALTLGGGSLIAYVLLWWLLDPAPAGSWTATDTEQTEAFPPPPADPTQTPRAA